MCWACFGAGSHRGQSEHVRLQVYRRRPGCSSTWNSPGFSKHYTSRRWQGGDKRCASKKRSERSRGEEEKSGWKAGFSRVTRQKQGHLCLEEHTRCWWRPAVPLRAGHRRPGVPLRAGHTRSVWTTRLTNITQHLLLKIIKSYVCFVQRTPPPPKSKTKHTHVHFIPNGSEACTV